MVQIKKMKQLSTKTLLSCLKEKADYELYPVAKEAANEALGSDVTGIICEILDPGNAKDEKLLAGLKHELIDSMNLSGHDEKEANALIADIEKTLKEKRMPISAIIDMFRLGANGEKSTEEEEFLYRKSREYTVLSYGRYVHSIINRMYSTYAEKMEDELYQCGVMGLLLALPVYDESKGAFTTLCKPFIMHEITTQLNFYHNDTTLHYNSLQKKINEAIKKLNEDGMEPTVQRISIITELRPEIVERELRCIECTKFLYLDAEQDDKDNGDRACEYEETPEAIYARKERTECLFASIKNLPKEIREVMVLRYEGDKTNEEIAAELHIKIGQVKTFYQKGLKMMRQDPLLLRLFPEFLSDAEREFLKYSMPIAASKKSVDDQIDDLINAMDDLSGMDNSDGLFDDFDSVLDSLRA